MNEATTVHDQVREYYGRVLGGSDDLKTDACCCATDAPPKYVLDVMGLVADEIVERFYGCGSPIPPALEGATVLDLGCGTGRDVYVISKLVGENGRVIGVDMTPEQLEVAERYREEQAKRFGFSSSNVELKCGYIEDLASLGIADESVDVVVSNCVINLSPFKDLVFSEIYRVLKPGGELFFSDVFSDRRIPEALRDDPVLRGECLGGALYLEDFRRMMASHGWERYAFTVVDDIHVGDFALETKLGFIGFTSRTVRAIKATGLEDGEEDFGQSAIYTGGISETPRYFDFDADTRFIKGKPRAISGNTARMLEQSRYGVAFEITRAGKHRGRFDALRAQEALEIRKGAKKVDLALLERACERCGITPFDERVGEPSLLRACEAPSTMQVNICYACNLACRHCYLECGPTRTESMSRVTMEACLSAFSAGGFKVLDITGGSPEYNPDFEWFLREGAKLGSTIVRTNATLLCKPEYEHLMDAFAETRSRVVISLPFYNGDGTDAQRGRGAFEKAVRTIRRLNELGYGRTGELPLDIVYNVAGPFLPPPQELVEEAYKEVLSREQGIEFDSLLAFNNYALGRFAADLMEAGMFDEYLGLLADNFNALAVTRMMCLDQVNVDADGTLYDCECNHVLGLPLLLDGRAATVADLACGAFGARQIRTNPICYSCAAGSGSSCGGSLV